MPAPSISSLLTFARSHGRICPMPCAWERLRRMLGPDSPRIAVLAGWWVVPPIGKMLIVASQIRFAAQHGKLGRVDRYLRRLRADEWDYLRPEERARAVTAERTRQLLLDLT